MVTSVDGTRIAWYRYGGGERAVLFVPTWNIVDARVVGHQVAALEPHATVVTTREVPAPVIGRSAATTFRSMRPMRPQSWAPPGSSAWRWSPRPEE
jgi:hypothetical protein